MHRFNKWIAFSLSIGLLLHGICTHAQTIVSPELNPNYPSRYVVKENDTLWDIAGKILQHPWQWQTLWKMNSQIKNPNKIYPGDIIEVYLQNQAPIIKVKSTGTVKLSPKVRRIQLDNAIPTIPLTEIKPFLSGNRIINPGALSGAPTIVAHEGERIIAGNGDIVYVTGLHAKGFTHYSIFRPGDTFKDIKTGKILGLAAVFVGDAELVKAGNPATMLLSNTRGEVFKGDKLLPREPLESNVYFTPKAPNKPINGNIIAVEGGLDQAGQYQVVVIDQGTQHGLEAGDVLDIYTNDRAVTHTKEEDDEPETIDIPGYKIGEMMVFRPFDEASYALVLKASNAIHVNEQVRNPREE